MDCSTVREPDEPDNIDCFLSDVDIRTLRGVSRLSELKCPTLIGVVTLSEYNVLFEDTRTAVPSSQPLISRPRHIS